MCALRKIMCVELEYCRWYMVHSCRFPWNVAMTTPCSRVFSMNCSVQVRSLQRDRPTGTHSHQAWELCNACTAVKCKPDRELFWIILVGICKWRVIRIYDKNRVCWTWEKSKESSVWIRPRCMIRLPRFYQSTSFEVTAHGMLTTSTVVQPSCSSHQYRHAQHHLPWS